MKRRSFLKGLVAAAGLLAVPQAAEILVPERKIWALDKTMATPPNVVYQYEFTVDLGRRMGERMAERIDEDLRAMLLASKFTVEHRPIMSEIVSSRFYDYAEYMDDWGVKLVWDEPIKEPNYGPLTVLSPA